MRHDQDPSKYAILLSVAGVTLVGGLSLYGMANQNPAPATPPPRLPDGPKVYFVPREGALPYSVSKRTEEGIDYTGDWVDPDVIEVYQQGEGGLCAAQGGEAEPATLSLPESGPHETDSTMDLTPDTSEPGVTYRSQEGKVTNIRENGRGGLVGLRGGQPVNITIKLHPC